MVQLTWRLRQTDTFLDEDKVPFNNEIRINPIWVFYMKVYFKIKHVYMRFKGL